MAKSGGGGGDGGGDGGGGDGGGGGGFGGGIFLDCKDFGRMFDHSFPEGAFFFSLIGVSLAYTNSTL